MPAILAALLELLGLVNILTSIAQNILGLSQHGAQEHIPYNIESFTVNTQNAVASPLYGLLALHNQLADIQAAIALLQVATNPVVLPTIPPSGYGADPGSVASYVWNYNLASSLSTAGDALASAGNAADAMQAGQVSFRSGWSPILSLRGSWAYQQTEADGYN